MAKVIRRETRQRGASGKLVKLVFILFNVIMLILMLVTCHAVGSVSNAAGTGEGADAVAAGAALGGAAMGGMIMFFWALGTVILGALTYFTRGPSVVTEETID